MSPAEVSLSEVSLSEESSSSGSASEEEDILEDVLSGDVFPCPEGSALPLSHPVRQAEKAVPQSRLRFVFASQAAAPFLFYFLYPAYLPYSQLIRFPAVH